MTGLDQPEGTTQNRDCRPTCWIIAGPNGAGKTTFALEYLPRIAGCKTFVNADLIATGLAPLAPERRRVAAGSATQETTQETGQETGQERGTSQETTQEKILALLREDPELTRRVLAERIGITPDGIRYHLDNLKKAGLIRHVGATRKGYWEILGAGHE